MLLGMKFCVFWALMYKFLCYLLPLFVRAAHETDFMFIKISHQVELGTTVLRVNLLVTP